MKWKKLDELPVDSIILKKLVLLTEGRYATYLCNNYHVVISIYQTFNSNEELNDPKYFKSKKLDDGTYIYGQFLTDSNIPLDKIKGWMFADELIDIYIKDRNEEYRSKYYIECDDGWLGLLSPIDDFIEKYNKENEDKITLTQVKEKFGTLRIYTSGYNEELNKLIKIAEEKSKTICEICGEPAELRNIDGYMRTLCDKCYKRKEQP